MRATHTIALISLLSFADAAVAQNRQPGGIPEGVPAMGKAGGATFDEPFADPGNLQAKALASREGISVGEATRRLRMVHKAGQLARRLERQSPESFSGMEVVETSTNVRFMARFVGGDKPENRARLETGRPDAELQGQLDVADASLSRSALVQTGDRLIREVRAAGVDADVAVNPFTGLVQFLAKDAAAMRAAIEGGAVRPPANYRIEQSEGIIPTTTLIAGAAYNAQFGNYAECTTGFAVLQSGTTRGISTAGHCDINSPAQYNGAFASHYGDAGGVTITYKQEWITNNLDFQWHTVASPHAVSPEYWDGASAITVTGAGQSLSGETLCKFGRTTGKTCGKVDPAWHWDVNYTGYFLRLNTSAPGTFLTLEGDSGGPVFSGSIAKGWIHGRDGTGNAYYMPVTELYNKVPSMQVLCIC